ncbi:MAG: hypothetical protein ABI610_08980 [Acidobacteriota bacterium]
MRLTEWRVGAPNREALSGRVLDVVVPVLESLGAEADPHCWVAWGDDPGIRFVIFAPTAAGLVTCSVRLALPGEGPRASGKVVRWHRVQLGELAVETVGGHRLVSFQVESQVLRGSDLVADRIAAFGLALFAAVDGRPMPDLGARKRRRKGAPAKTSKGSSATKRATAAKPRAVTARPAAPRPAPAIAVAVPAGSGSIGG